MSKEQTPIEVVESLKGKNEIEQARTILDFTNAKVLEALEREFSKVEIELFDEDRSETYIEGGKFYYETQVKPNYELQQNKR